MTHSDDAPLDTARAEPVLNQIALTRSEVVGDAPQSLSGSVGLSAPALAGGKEIELFSDRPDVVTLPASVTVPAGETSVAFDATLRPVGERIVTVVTAKHKDGDTTRWAPLLIHAAGEVGAGGPSATNDHPPTDSHLEAAPAPSAQAPGVNGTGVSHTAAPAPAPAETTPAATQEPTSQFAEIATSMVAALDPAWTPVTQQSFRAALQAIIPGIPFVAVIAMLVIYAAPPSSVLSLFDPILAGTAVAVICGIIAAFVRWRIVQDTSADRANSSSYDELRERLSAITARFSLAAERIDDDQGRQMALREVQGWRAQILAELSSSGPGWVLGSAYLNVWKLIHRAEEALLELLPTAQAVAEALYDEQRLAGSQVDDRDQLLTRLRLAVARLDNSSMVYLNQQPAPAAGGAAAPLPDLPSQQTARTVLREIRRTINEFRDDSWGGIVRARNHLMRSLTLTGIVTYFGLLLALDLSNKTTGYDLRSDAIIAATVFYLVGALVGLFNRLSSETNGDNDMEDYGLTEARLTLTPVLSGLAAIGGVYLTAMLTGTLNGVVTAGTPATNLVLPHAAAILNLSQNPFGLVLAAVFGLSPTVLISALQAQADKYKGALQSTAAHS